MGSIIKLCFLNILLLNFVFGDILDVSYFTEEACGGQNKVHLARNARGCSWFWYCNSNNVVIGQDRCPGGFRFNFDEQICDLAENVECNFDDIPVNYSCPGNALVTFVPHPQSCSMYTVCLRQIQNDRECEPGTHFSIYDRACVDPFFADCKIDQEICKETIGTELLVFLPNPRDCNSFFVCSEGTSYFLRCAAGYYFSSDIERCVLPSAANCTSLIPENNPIIPELTSMDCQGSFGQLLPHPDSCQFYFLCTSNQSYLQFCGNGLVFDTRSKICRVPSAALCILDIVTDPPTTTEEESTTVEEESTMIEETTITEEDSTTIKEESTTTEEETTTMEEDSTTIEEESTTTEEESTTIEEESTSIEETTITEEDSTTIKEESTTTEEESTTIEETTTTIATTFVPPTGFPPRNFQDDFEF